MAANELSDPIKVATLEDLDAKILQAWERREAAFARYFRLPSSRWDEESPEEAECWAIIGAAEEEIRSAVAMTPRGIELQLWVALDHRHEGGTPKFAFADLESIDPVERSLDWDARMLVSAIRSLRVLGASRH